MPVASIGRGAVTILAVVLIVLALVFYLVSTIVAAAEDHGRARRGHRHVGEIMREDAPVDESRRRHQPAASTPASTCSRACS